MCANELQLYNYVYRVVLRGRMVRAVVLFSATAALAWCPGQASAFLQAACGGFCPALARPRAAARPGALRVVWPVKHSRPARAGARGLTAALDGYDSLLTLDSPVAWAAFLLWSVPLPVTIGAVLRLASAKAGGEARAPLETIEMSTDKPLGEQRNLMWAFPSFSCFLQDPDAQPPLAMPLWQKFGLFLNSWAGLAWYLNYKYKIEEELKAYKGEGLGGAIVVYPFAGGFASGILGEYLFGSLELPPFSDVPSTLFWGGFAWIYVMQFILYSSVNELYRSKGLQEPLLTWGLLVPGYNFVTGIRQVGTKQKEISKQLVRHNSIERHV
jgi:hypothetical protein